MVEEKANLGIDLGTSHCVLSAWSKEEHKTFIIPDEYGNRLIPSMIAFSQEQQQWVFGDLAKRQLYRNASNTVFDVKLLLGRKFSDPEVQKLIKVLPFDIVSKNGKAAVQMKVENNRIHTFYPEELTAKLLDYLVDQAAIFLKLPEMKNDSHSIYGVISVPAYYSPYQIAATKDAARISGLKLRRLIAEPTCAAYSYALGKDEYVEAKPLLVFDLGGGTFDVSLLIVEADIFEVKAVAGDTHLGGERFTQTLADYCGERFRAKHGCSGRFSSRELARLYLKCEEAKVTLTEAKSALIFVESFSDGIDLNQKITRDQFEDLNKQLFQTLLLPVERVLRDSKITIKDVDKIVMVGGSTRVPKVQELVSKFFNGKGLLKDENPDEIVAKGAAQQAAMLSGTDSGGVLDEALLLDVNPHSLGIGVNKSEILKIHYRTDGTEEKKDFLHEIGDEQKDNQIAFAVVRRNTTLPARTDTTLTTLHHNQTSMYINIFSGESLEVENNLIIGSFVLTNISPMSKGEAQVRIMFDLDANSNFKVTCTDPGSGRELLRKEIIVRNLSDGEIEQNIKALQAQKDDEEQRSEQAEAAVVLKEHLDNPVARKNLIEYQRDIFGNMFKISRYLDYKESANRIESLRTKITQVVEAEIQRILSLIEKRTTYYSKAKLRWNYLLRVRMNNSATEPHIQPVGFKIKCSSCEKSLTNIEEDPTLLARISAQVLMNYFEYTLRKLVNELNTAPKIEELELPESVDAVLPFLDEPIFCIGGKRVEVSFGPVKKVDRAQEKVCEYQNEIINGKKADKSGKDRDLTGIDYLLDWLRATVSSQDPYALYVFFKLLERSPHFNIQRIKNKILDGGENDVKTNVLINVVLLYPPKEGDYDPLSLLGPFEEKRAGEELLSCEIQLTLQDFLTIKRLQHTYYDIQRSGDPNFLLQNPVFLKENNLTEKEPSVVKDMRRLRYGGAVNPGSVVEIHGMEKKKDEHLNGMTGTIKSFNEDLGQASVVLDGEVDTEIYVQAKNLTGLPHTMEDALAEIKRLKKENNYLKAEVKKLNH